MRMTLPVSMQICREAAGQLKAQGPRLTAQGYDSNRQHAKWQNFEQLDKPQLAGSVHLFASSGKGMKGSG